MTEQSAGQRPASRGRRNIVVALTAVASPLVWVALALACTPHASLSLTTADGVVAQPGAVATVTGNAFGAGRVDVRWDSTSGAVLATTRGPSFSVSITVPAAEPGYHNVVAIGHDPEGNVVGQAVAVLEIPVAEKPAAAPAASASGPGVADEAADAPASSDTASPSAAPAASRPAVPARGRHRYRAGHRRGRAQRHARPPSPTSFARRARTLNPRTPPPPPAPFPVASVLSRPRRSGARAVRPRPSPRVRLRTRRRRAPNRRRRFWPRPTPQVPATRTEPASASASPCSHSGLCCRSPDSSSPRRAAAVCRSVAAASTSGGRRFRQVSARVRRTALRLGTARAMD